jgi:hypothetical protein
MREMLLAASKSYCVGMINKHISNVEILLTRSVGIGEHQDIQDAIDKELEKVAQFDDKLLGKYDAPLKLQFNHGITGFKLNKNNPFKENSMQHREWQRGYNFAYFKQATRNESRKRS